MADVQITIGADLSEMLNSIKQGSSLTKQQARDMEKGLKEAFRSATRESVQLRKTMDKQRRAMASANAEAKLADERFRSAKEAAGIFGGQVGALAEMADKARNSMASAEAGFSAGGAAMLAGAVAATTYAAVLVKVWSATMDAVRASKEWIDELEKAGATVDGDTRRSIETLNQTLDALRLAALAVGVELIGGMAPALNRMADAALITADVMRQLEEKTGLVSLAGAALVEVMMQLTPGAKSLEATVDALAIAFPRTAAGAREFRDALGETGDELEVVEVGLRDWLKLMPNISAVTKQAIADAKERQAEESKAAADRVRRLKEEEEQRRATLAQIGAYWAEADRLSTEADQRERDQRNQTLAEIKEYWETVEQLESEAAAKELARQKKQAEAIQQYRIQTAISATQAIQVVYSGLYDWQTQKIDNLEARQEAARNSGMAGEAAKIEQEIQGAKRAAKQVWAMQKALSLSEVAFSTAAAVMRSFALLGGPASPLAQAAAVAAIAAGAAQSAAIAARPPPTFPTGGMVGDKVDGDHVLVGAMRNEAILTPRGVHTAGGREGVDALNAGRGGAPQQIVIQLDREIIATAVADPATSRAIARAVAPHLGRRGF